MIQNAINLLVFSCLLFNEIHETVTNYHAEYCRQNVSYRRYKLRIFKRRELGML